MDELRQDGCVDVVHCADDVKLQGITGSHFLRDDDRRVFSDSAVKHEIEAMGIEIISW